MAVLKLTQFSGEIPRMIPRLLPDTAAQRAENVRLDDGGLTPIRKQRLEHNFTLVEGDPAPVTVYKHGDEWLQWPTIVNAAPGPVAEDRLYFTGDGVPKMRVDGTNYPLAVPMPSTALTLTLGGTGSGDVVTRLYVYTFVTSFGEESEPCPISDPIDWQPGNTVTLSGFQAAPSGRAITKQRIYRSQSSIATGTDLFFIAERDVSSGDFVDDIDVEDFAEVIPSKDWNPPPDDLEGLIPLPNGMMAAFKGKDLYFCEPFRPHAWPEKYVLTMAYNIVALGSYGTTIVVATDGQPELVDGSAPDSMQQAKMEVNLPCINARGVVDLGYAVAYPSHDGLVIASGGSVNVATSALMTRDNWLKTSPGTFVAGQYSGRYFASYEYLGADNIPQVGTFIFDLTGSQPFLLRASIKADACYYDIKGSALYMLKGTEVYEWDALGQLNEIMTWRSKQFILPAPVNYGCILVEGANGMTPDEVAAFQAEIEAVEEENATIFAQDSIGGEINGAAFNVHPVNGDELLEVPTANFAVVTVIADGNTVATVNKLNKVVRLPAGFSARQWEIEVNGTAAISQISLATTIRELNQI